MMWNSDSATTIGARVEATGGRSSGFDYLRVGLAIAVVLWHAFPISYGRQVEVFVLGGSLRPIIASILPAFFALSGFLVAGSLERSSSLLRFIALRIIRIGPALGVEVFLSALVLGPWLTTIAWADYFADRAFWSYFLNVLGVIHFTLPGLFASNPVANIVNGQLWTIPYELECYAALAGIAAVGFFRRSHLMLGAVAGLQILLITRALWPIANAADVPELGGIFSGRLLVMSFLWGVVLFRLRAKIPYRGWLAAGLGAVAVALMLAPLGDVFASPLIAYVTMYVGLQNPRRTAIVSLGDFSYGIFLYGFVVQQFVASLGTWTHHWYVNAGLALPLVTLFAAFSWYCVEKPALRLRAMLPILDPLDTWLGAQQERFAKLARIQSPAASRQG